MNRIYLDNAATSWPKPEVVYEAVDRYQRTIGVAAGRGSYRNADAVDRTLTRLRSNLSKLIGSSDSPSQCVFTQNCTEALNLALHGTLREGDHVVTTEIEHNSIMRPLAHLARMKGIRVTTVEADSEGLVSLENLSSAVMNATRLIAITHGSNVTGAVQPIAEVGRIAAERDCLLLVDAAQTLGHVPLNVETNHIDLLAAPGHKGLLGPLGTGFLYIRSGLETQLCELHQGGTGTSSELLDQPEQLPAKYESGNANVPGLVGLDAGVKYVLDEKTIESSTLQDLTEMTIQEVSSLSNVKVHSRVNPCGIVSFNLNGFDPREVATMLDGAAGIEVRAGLHCAPGVHRRIGTFDSGGCVRASFGHFSTQDCAKQLVEAVSMLASS